MRRDGEAVRGQGRRAGELGDEPVAVGDLLGEGEEPPLTLGPVDAARVVELRLERSGGGAQLLDDGGRIAVVGPGDVRRGAGQPLDAAQRAL